MRLRIAIPVFCVLLLLLYFVIIHGKTSRDDGASSDTSPNIPFDGLRISGTEVDPPRRHFQGDEVLIQQFLEKHGRTARNLIVAATLAKKGGGSAFIEEAYKLFPGDPMVLDAALSSGNVAIDLAQSASFMIKAHPNSANGYIAAALAALETGDEVTSLAQIRKVIASGLESEDYVLELMAGRYEYAREFELMDKVAAASAARRYPFSGNIVHSHFMDYARQAREKSVISGQEDRADEWSAMGLAVAIACAPSPSLSQIEGNTLRQKGFVESMSDTAISLYLETSKEDILNSINSDISDANRIRSELASIVDALSYSDYENYVEVLMARGEKGAFLWLQDSGH